MEEKKKKKEKKMKRFAKKKIKEEKIPQNESRPPRTEAKQFSFSKKDMGEKRGGGFENVFCMF